MRGASNNLNLYLWIVGSCKSGAVIRCSSLCRSLHAMHAHRMCAHPLCLFRTLHEKLCKVNDQDLYTHTEEALRKKILCNASINVIAASSDSTSAGLRMTGQAVHQSHQMGDSCNKFSAIIYTRLYVLKACKCTQKVLLL